MSRSRPDGLDRPEIGSAADTVMAFVLTRFADPIRVADIAAHAGLSVRTLQRVCRRRFGVTPVELIHQVRLDQARALLAAAEPGTLLVADVAATVGDPDPATFGVRYRRRFGETPSQTLRTVVGAPADPAPVRRVAMDRYWAASMLTAGPGTAFTGDQRITWEEYRLDREFTRVRADAELGALFELPTGTELLRRRFVFHARDEPQQISVNFLPWDLVGDTPVSDPSREPWPGGTLAQLTYLGHPPTRVEEAVRSRMPTPEEAETLRLTGGVPVLAITRRMLSRAAVMEVCRDIVLPADRVILDYSIDLDPRTPPPEAVLRHHSPAAPPPDPPPGDWPGDWPDSSEDTHIVTTTPDARYQTLTAEQRRAYRLLTQIPGPYVATGTASAALHTGPAAADQLLTALHQAELVDRLPGGEPEVRWRMPDQIAEHAAALTHDEPDEPDEADEADEADSPNKTNEAAAVLARAIRHNLGRAARLDRVIAPARNRYAPVFGWRPDTRVDVDADIAPGDEQRAVRRVQNMLEVLLADQAAAADAGLHHLAWQYVDALWGFLRLTKPFAQWDRICVIALDSATRCDDPGAQARIHLSAGLRARRLGDLAGALDHHRAALQAARRAGDSLTEAACAEHHGATLLEMGEPDQALRILTQGLELYRVLPPHPRGQALLQRHLANAYSLLGQHDLADQHFGAAQQIFTQLGEPYLLARLSTNRAEAALRLGEPARALAHLNLATEHLPNRSVSDDAYLEVLRASAHADAHEQDAAHHALDRARRLCDDLPSGHPTIPLVQQLRDRLGPTTTPPATRPSPDQP